MVFALGILPFPASLIAQTQSRPSGDTNARAKNLYAPSHPTDRPFVKKFVTNFLLDQKSIWTSPAHITSSSAPWWIFAGAGTGILLAVDHPVSQALPTSGSAIHFGTVASRFGQWYAVFPASGALLGMGAVFHNGKLFETGAASLEALADADLVTNVLKVAARRQRPLDGDRGGHFEKGGSSFPSGHSTQAWALATVLAAEYGNHSWVPFAAYSYATLISAARVTAQEHFLSDVFVGAAVGFFIGRYVVRTQHARDDGAASRSSGIWKPTVVPAATAHSLTMHVGWNLIAH